MKALETELQEEIKEQWEDINRKAAKEDIAVLQTPSGYVLAPLRDGKVIEELGYYDPMVRETDARAILKRERVDY